MTNFFMTVCLLFARDCIKPQSNPSVSQISSHVLKHVALGFHSCHSLGTNEGKCVGHEPHELDQVRPATGNRAWGNHYHPYYHPED